MSIHVAVKGAERTIPSWEHLQAQRPNHKSFEESKSPSIRPWIQAWALTWMIHWWGFLATAKKVLLSEQVGTHADHTLLFYFHEAMGQTESIYSNIYSALLESEQRHYCIARGFLKWPGPTMGLSPANPSAFPGFGVPWSLGFGWAATSEVPFSLKPWSATGRGGGKGTSESRKTNP